MKSHLLIAGGGIVGPVAALTMADLLYREAVASGLDKETEAAMVVEMARREALAGLLLQRQAQAEVTDEAVVAMYEARSVESMRVRRSGYDTSCCHM